MEYTSQIVDFIKYTNGRGVDSIVEYYYATAIEDATVPNVGSSDWKTTIKASGHGPDKRYLWNYEKIIYSYGNPGYTTPAIISTRAAEIDKIYEFYQLNNSDQVPTTLPTTTNRNGWSLLKTDIQTIPVPTEENRYLWNYEIITYKGNVQDNPNQSSGPACVSVYGGSPYSISLDNDSDIIVISSASGNILGNYPTITAKTFQGAKEMNVGVVTIVPTGCTLNTTTGRTCTITGTTSDSGSVEFKWRPNGSGKEPVISKTFTFSKTTSNADYDLIIPQTTFNNKNKAVVEVSILRKKDSAAADTIAPNTDGNIIIQYQQSGGTWQELKASSFEVAANNTSKYTVRIIKAADKDKSDPFVWDSEVIEFVSDGAPGKDAVAAASIALSNDKDIVPASSTGVVNANTALGGATTTLTLYKNGVIDTDTNPNVTCVVKANNQTALTLNTHYSFENKKFQLKTWNNSWNSVVATFTYTTTIDGKTVKPTKDFVMTKMNTEKGEDAVDYWLELSKTSANTTSGGGSVTVTAKKTVGSSSTNLTTGYTINCSNGSSSQNNPMTYSYSQNTTGEITFTLTIDNVEWDKQTLLLVKNGDKGGDGRGINSTTITYAVTNSKVDPTTITTWFPQNQMPLASPEQYLWTRTIIDYTSGDDTVSYTYSYQGKTGTPGTSVSVEKIEYQAGTSATTAPTGTWQTTIPSVGQGQYLWSKTTFSDSKIAYGVSYQSVDGDPAQDFNITASSYALVKESKTATTYKNSITLTAHLMNINQQIQWKDVNGNWGSATSTLTKTVTAAGTYEARTADGKWRDSITITEVVDGATGKDAIAITLSNPTMTFHADTNGESETCEVIVFEGSNKLTTTATTGARFSVAKQGSPNGVNVNGGIITIQDQATKGSATFTVTVWPSAGDPITQSLTINWIVVEDGKNGDDGTSTTPIVVYKTGNSQTTPPNLPATNNYEGWSVTPPTTGNVWKCEGSKIETPTGVTSYVWSTPKLYAIGTNIAYANQLNTFYELTQNGTKKGLIKGENDDLYFNADFINTGTLRVGSVNTPILEAFFGNANNTNPTVKMAGWTVTPNSFTTGTFGGSDGFHIYPKGAGNILFNEYRDWKMAIGNSFGVTSEGAMFAKAGQIGNLEIAHGGIIMVQDYAGINSYRPEYDKQGRPVIIGGGAYAGAQLESEHVGSHVVFLRSNYDYIERTNSTILAIGDCWWPNEWYPDQHEDPDLQWNDEDELESQLKGCSFRVDAFGNVFFERDVSIQRYGEDNALYFGTTELIGIEKDISPSSNQPGLIFKFGSLAQQNSGFIRCLGYGVSTGIDGQSLFFKTSHGHKNMIYTLANSDGAGIHINIRGTKTVDFWQSSTKFYNSVQNSGGTVQFTSDKNLKNNILTIPHNYDTFFDALNPVIFKYNNGTSGRFHTGFIAQEVDIARELAQISRQDLSIICIDKEGTEEETWYLRYSNFIPINTWQIQLLKPRMTAAEEKIAKLELEISSLKTELENLKKS